MALTKTTLTTFENPVTDVPQGWLTDVFAKVDEMVNAGKTDGYFEFVNDHVVQRWWLDQPAVEEWLAFFTSCCQTYSVVVTDINTQDVPT